VLWKSVDKEIGPGYTWIGNSLTASNQSASRAAVVASRNTIRRC